MKKMYSFRLDTDLVEEVKRIAKEQDRTLTNLVVRVFKQTIKQHSSQK